MSNSRAPTPTPNAAETDGSNDSKKTPEATIEVTIRYQKGTVVLPEVVATVQLEPDATFATLRSKLPVLMADSSQRIFGLGGGRFVRVHQEPTLSVATAASANAVGGLVGREELLGRSISCAAPPSLPSTLSTHFGVRPLL